MTLEIEDDESINMIKEEDDDDDESTIEPCCGGNDRKKRICMCLPYDDPYIITAQILSLVAFVFSWIWWASFFVSGIALVLFQVNWCCRRSRVGLLTSHIISVAAAVLCICAGVYALIEWKNQKFCHVFIIVSDDDYIYDGDKCTEQIYATIAFFDAALWLATAYFTIKFVTSGRYAKWEALYSNTTDDDGDIDKKEDSASEEAIVEMGTVGAALEEGTIQSAPTDDVASTPADFSTEEPQVEWSKVGNESLSIMDVATEIIRDNTDPDVEEA